MLDGKGGKVLVSQLRLVGPTVIDLVGGGSEHVVIHGINLGADIALDLELGSRSNAMGGRLCLHLSLDAGKVLWGGDIGERQSVRHGTQLLVVAAVLVKGDATDAHEERKDARMGLLARLKLDVLVPERVRHEVDADGVGCTLKVPF